MGAVSTIDTQYALTRDQLDFRAVIRQIAQERVAPRATEIDARGEYPTDIRDLFAEHDLFGLPFAEEHGGTGTGALMLCVAIEARDTTGFIVNRLLVPYLLDAVRVLESGVATREDIDEGMKLGCGHPMGPLTLCDFIGLDVLYSVCDSLYDEFKRDEYAPPPLMKRMVVSGHLGRKTGRGFYEYD